MPWLTEGDGRRRARLRLRWEGEDGRLLWFGSSLAPIWSSNDRFIRNMEFILLKKMDAKGRFNFRRGGSILQRRGIFAAEGHFRSLFRSPFCSCEMRGVCFEMALVCQGVFRTCEMGFGCENWRFHALGISQPFPSCEMRVEGYEMALVCQEVVSQLRKFS